MYFAIRVGVASAILIAIYVSRGFESGGEAFAIAFGAALAGQALALGVKLLAGDQPRTRRSLALLVCALVVAAAAITFALAT